MTMPYEIAFPSTTAAQIRVAILDRVGQVDGLASHLPRRWVTQHYDSLYAVASFDLIVLGGATAELVAAAPAPTSRRCHHRGHRSRRPGGATRRGTPGGRRHLRTGRR